MEPDERARLLEFIANLLRDREDTGPLADNESLFVSARLDSLSAVELIEFLEGEFDVDFAKIDFDVARIDSINAISGLVKELRAVSTTIAK
jgi:acyl carrier protein